MTLAITTNVGDWIAAGMLLAAMAVGALLGATGR